jgi:hypothetical protein
MCINLRDFLYKTRLWIYRVNRDSRRLFNYGWHNLLYNRGLLTKRNSPLRSKQFRKVVISKLVFADVTFEQIRCILCRYKRPSIVNLFSENLLGKYGATSRVVVPEITELLLLIQRGSDVTKVERQPVKGR